MSQNQEEFTVKLCDLENEMLEDAKEIIKESLTTLGDEREMAKNIKLHFDEKWGKIWHCVVGRSFGAFGTHETKHFLYIYYKTTAVQLWKCGYIYEKKVVQEQPTE